MGSTAERVWFSPSTQRQLATRPWPPSSSSPSTRTAPARFLPSRKSSQALRLLPAPSPSRPEEVPPPLAPLVLLELPHPSSLVKEPTTPATLAPAHASAASTPSLNKLPSTTLVASPACSLRVLLRISRRRDKGGAVAGKRGCNGHCKGWARLRIATMIFSSYDGFDGFWMASPLYHFCYFVRGRSALYRKP